MGKIIVITGAGVGLGRALARRFVADGDEVVLLGRTLAKVQAVAGELGAAAMAVGCDVADPASVRQAFAEIAGRHPRIDVLINNAAVFEPFTVAEATDAQIMAAVATNLAGPIYCARSAIPLLGAGGHIINVSSESLEVPLPHLSLYQASKAGLERFSRSLGEELEADGIRVTALRAGQMGEEGKAWDVPPEARMRFGQAAMERGLNLRARPITDMASMPGIFRALIDLPPDLHVDLVSLHARAATR